MKTSSRALRCATRHTRRNPPAELRRLRIRPRQATYPLRGKLRIGLRGSDRRQRPQRTPVLDERAGQGSPCRRSVPALASGATSGTPAGPGGWRAAVVRSRGRLAGAARVLPCATESARRGNRRRRCRCCLALRAQAPVDDIPTRRPGEGDRPARRLAIQPHTRALRRRYPRCSELVAPTDAIARPRQGRSADLPAARISPAWLGFRP